MRRPLSLFAILILSGGLASPVFAACTPPAISISPSNPTCGSPATLDAGGGWVSYHWTDAYGYDYGTSQTMMTGFSGTYTVEVTDANGCTTSASASVAVNDFHIARAPSAACLNQLIQERRDRRRARAVFVEPHERHDRE